VEDAFESYEVRTANFYQGHWIDHPAQANLYQVPEPLRSECVASFLASRQAAEEDSPPQNYQDWLDRAFGSVFARTFPAAYTRKYWTREPRDLATEWVGGRVFNPQVSDVIEGSKGPLAKQTHYITKVRYPSRGGYQAFAAGLRRGADIRFGSSVARIDLGAKRLWTEDGSEFSWRRLINTLPLPVFIATCVDVPQSVQDAARALACSKVLIVNATAPHETRREENWLYVYDEDKLSTRINFTERLSPANAPAGHTGVQVEVYASRYRPFDASPETTAARVVDELLEMDLLTGSKADISFHTLLVPWANVIFDHDAMPALECIWRWLEGYGLQRDAQDLHPLTDWAAVEGEPNLDPGSLVMAGRFGQWKYYWTDDCVLRGRQLALKDGPKNPCA
jgi:protoporphyrinogen oxidase